MSKNIELEVEIGSDGQVHVHVKGAKGEACLEYAKLMEEVLGRVSERELTAEYHEKVDVQGKVERHVKRRED